MKKVMLILAAVVLLAVVLSYSGIAENLNVGESFSVSQTGMDIIPTGDGAAAIGVIGIIILIISLLLCPPLLLLFIFI